MQIARVVTSLTRTLISDAAASADGNADRARAANALTRRLIGARERALALMATCAVDESVTQGIRKGRGLVGTACIL